MPDFKYLIVGGGMTAAAAVSGIRSLDGEGSIGVVSMESDPPYDRPPLSKGLWKGKPLEKIWRDTQDLGVTLYLERQAHVLDRDRKQVADTQGEVYTFDRLLLATGGRPRRLPFGEEAILYYRTLADYRRLRALTETRQRFGVIGGGFIGSEVAAALATNDRQAVMIFPEEGIGARMFPRELALFLNDYYRERGVEVLAGCEVVGVEPRSEGAAIRVRGADGSEREIAVDAVVAGIGIQPNVELAEAAGLEVADGIVVDGFLRTSAPDIYAAGDVAAFHNPALGMRLRVEHEDNANSQGRIAGRNMAGVAEPYNHLPMFYSDLFDLGYEAVGLTDARLEVVADWAEPNRKGVLYYLRDGRVRGVILWNVWDQVEAARRLIAEPGPFQPGDLKGRLPE